MVRFVPGRLEGLGRPASDRRRLGLVRAALRRRFPQVDRLAVALYDSATRTVETFAASERRSLGLTLYDAPLRDAPSLRRVFRTRSIRVVDDLRAFSRGRRRHHRALRASGYRSSATFPVVMDGRFLGFVFLDSRRPAAFADRDLPLLEVFARLAAHEATAGLRGAAQLRSALRTAVSFVHARDPETGDHLERMARYARLIAQELARSGRWKLDDERIRWIEEFAPLHDVGKLGIPDVILNKPGPLEPHEMELIRSHARIGYDILKSSTREMLKTAAIIALEHHERFDGTGYPDGLIGRRIPMAARMISVADVWDALTSDRPWREAYEFDDAYAMMKEGAGTQFDPQVLTPFLTSLRKLRSQGLID